MATIEIDGKQFEVIGSKSIIEVADEHQIAIPRFCYHKKLSVAANCRMCMVEVEKSRKPLPACATPITDGMKIFTKSPLAIAAQQAIMEFLLINHPLDCPVCDQGGECELQDVSLSFGRGISEYSESKRAVDSDNLGALIATDMTRCIHCTRCVRFGEEVAGLRELGGTGRGEDVHIGTFVQHSLKSEVSGNIIDLCPVGALTSKPFRFSARPWELTQYAGIAPHDCLGSNLEFHVRRDQLLRIVPQENESINETWLSDRDRFSYAGLNSAARLTVPMIKTAGQWQETDWHTALTTAATSIKQVIKQHGARQLAGFASPSATLEEMYLFQKLLRQQGVNNLDHRLQQCDFSDEACASLYPVMSTAYESISVQDAILLVGSHLKHEQPLANVRVRTAFRHNAKIMALNPIDYDLNYTLSDKIIAAPQYLPLKLAQLVTALADAAHPLPPAAVQLLEAEGLLQMPLNAAVSNIAATLRNGKRSMIIVGAIAHNHPHAATIKALVALLGLLCGAVVVNFTTGANAAGAWLAGMVPHRQAMGKAVSPAGLNIQAALRAKLRAYILLGIEAEFDIACPQQAMSALSGAEVVVMLTAFKTDTMLEYADVLLPLAPYAETSGTYINIAGAWQSFQGAITPRGTSRPGWKILRVLGNLCGVHGFEYSSTTDVLQELQQLYASSERNNCGASKTAQYFPEHLPRNLPPLTRIGEWPLYCIDSLCRHAPALQQQQAVLNSHNVAAHINPVTVQKYHLSQTVTVSQDDIAITLPLVIDNSIAEDAIYVASALPETSGLGLAYGEIAVE